MLLALSNALILLIDGVLRTDKDAITASVSILTVALPIGLIVIALVFGDGGSSKLRDLTPLVLNTEVPQAIRENLSHSNFSEPLLSFQTKGYITDYKLEIKHTNCPIVVMNFALELNVKKVNAVFWIKTNGNFSTDAKKLMESNHNLLSCLNGAELEGYKLNPIATLEEDSLACIVFIKQLHPDFLLEPSQRLYFAQDFAFFARGMLEAHVKNN